MIIAERKPLDAILGMMTPYHKVLVVGCGTCASVCLAGGAPPVRQGVPPAAGGRGGGGRRGLLHGLRLRRATAGGNLPAAPRLPAAGHEVHGRHAGAGMVGGTLPRLRGVRARPRENERRGGTCMSAIAALSPMMKSDLEIAQEAILLPVVEIARRLGLSEDDLDLYGKFKAKLHLNVLDRLAGHPDGKYVTVTAITPTPLGEGKTTTAIGLGMALNRLGRKTINTLRQPSMGPTFGIKGGAAGGGYSQAVPMEDFNLHFTGDIHAVSAAHNLLAAMLDAHILHGNELKIDPYSITWPRKMWA